MEWMLRGVVGAYIGYTVSKYTPRIDFTNEVDARANAPEALPSGSWTGAALSLAGPSGDGDSV